MKKIKHLTTTPALTIRSLAEAPELIQELVRSRYAALAAEVDPEFLANLSKLVEHELVAQKDNEDYNLDLVSQVIDKAVRIFMEGGQKEIKPGDLIRVQEGIVASIKGQATQDFKNSVASGNYSLFPFSSMVEAELRSHFLLKTNRKDTIKGLLAELEANIFRVMPAEEFAVLKQALTAAEARILNTTLLFPAPLEGNEQGQLRNLTAEEMKKLGLEGTLTVDERKDSHDLLTLKELVAIVKGEPVHPLSIGPAFWAKYMPEIKQLGYDGVIAKVEDNLLQEMRLVKVPARGIHYSPVEAATMLYFNLVNFKYEPIPNKPGAVQMVMASSLDEKLLDEKHRYFVVVDGCVSVPGSQSPYDYEAFSKNDTRLAAGEVFLFEKLGGETVQTRTCFIPYEPAGLHPLHQHGTVVFGSNDQSFHSCHRNPKDFAHSSMDDFKEWWHNRVKTEIGSQGDEFSPAMVAARLHWFMQKPDGKPSTPTDLFREDNIKAQELVIHSISERTEFTKYWMLKVMPAINFYLGGKNREMIKQLCLHEAPLNRRWLARQYVVDGKGLTKDLQPTFYVALAKKMETDKLKSNFDFMLKLQGLKDLTAGGMKYDQAASKIFGGSATPKKNKKPD